MSIVRLDIADRTQATAAHTRSASPAEEAAFLEDLRRRAAERLERGYRFLESQPDAWALARANVLFGAMAPERLTNRGAFAQYASVCLAENLGYETADILRYFYGDDIGFSRPLLPVIGEGDIVD